MSLEDICAVEGLFCRRSGTRAETTYHGAFVVCESVPVLVVLPTKAFDVIIACLDGAFLGPLILVGEQMGFQVLE
jgi:hypothetical protein